MEATIPTLTLQLAFDPVAKNTQFGRFVDDNACGGTRSKVWIYDPKVAHAKSWIFSDASPVTLSAVALDPNTPSVHVKVIGLLPDGWKWSEKNSLRITAVFGRDNGAAPAEQDLASPFASQTTASDDIAALSNKVVGTLFDQTFILTDDEASNRGSVLTLGRAVFPPDRYNPNMTRIYAFNVAAVANLTNSDGEAVSLNFGHDPIMGVGS